MFQTLALNKTFYFTPHNLYIFQLEKHHNHFYKAECLDFVKTFFIYIQKKMLWILTFNYQLEYQLYHKT